jgi:hypothetical protein
MTKPAMILWLSDAHGQYIPQLFAKSFSDRDKHVEGVSDDDWLTLEEGPTHLEYWDAWLDVTDNAVVTDANGEKYTVYHDGDCWLVPLGMIWNDKTETFIWPEEEEQP